MGGTTERGVRIKISFSSILQIRTETTKRVRIEIIRTFFVLRKLGSPEMHNGSAVEAKNNQKHIPHGECAIHDMEIASTKVEMFREEKETAFCAFIVKICLEKKENSLKLKK